jgi:hypothetical protein
MVVVGVKGYSRGALLVNLPDERRVTEIYVVSAAKSVSQKKIERRTLVGEEF